MNGSVGEGEEKEENEKEEEVDDDDDVGNEEEVNEVDVLADANVEKVNACCTCCVVQKDALWLKYIPRSFHVAACKYTCIAQLSFTRIARGVGIVTRGGSEKEETEKEGEEEDIFDKEVVLGIDMSSVFFATEKKSVKGDEGLSGFGGVSTRTEGVDNWM
ncbi:uncharacterized protein MONOS_11884 [Monocercomonoides exilis]|uniref:uncharacterized protein n=1 Tax=Monocercomonoides exilis TaxID=2049356 RepID=UPI00355A18EB|nr:hypothetical protein MONOS_11884 [Monocercomonoides exilis]|eukprot:MONOS_11884.1-p1 / transcript=MONOS_11884.1 / gene=MONOS_11884 / organism=Monocercomonoides_exilis_PA203 / gene_product=unspecified product / transcript_product=unspecified product / location=Mono_scaffold00621:34185-34881(-) / protein_length=160 / sequence_SO=supercontig / SO=protein_coding / is_pseudo=false